MTFLARYQAQLHGLLRIVAGLLFLEHGTQKLLNFPPMAMQIPPEMKTLIMVAGAIELIGGALIAIGFQTRLVAFICAGEMAIAYWMGHFARTGEFFPANNGGDAAILFCFVFLFLAAAGPGAWSVDRK